MKKYVAFLLCLMMILSLISCNDNNTNEKENHPTNINTTSEIPSEITDKEDVEDYSKILNMYRGIIEILPNFSQEAMDNCCDELGIVSEEEKELFKEISWSTFDFKKSPPYNLSCGYAIKDLNGDGVDELVLLNNEYYVIAVFSYADDKPVLLGNYMPRGSCWIDGDGLLHVDASGGVMCNDISIYKIANGGNQLTLQFGYGMCDQTDNEEYKVEYYKKVNDEKIIITEAEYNHLCEQYGNFLGSVAGARATKEYSGLVFISMYPEAEIAMEMYKAAINDDICVFDEHLGEIKLKACRFPSNNVRLDESELLNKAILDMDGDGINEYVIQSPDKDHIVLHYDNGKVYSYCFDSSHFYKLNTDGTFYWNDSSEVGKWEGGLNKIVFEGKTWNIKSVYRLKASEKGGNDISDPDDFEFYINGEAVTESEYFDFDIYRTNMTFTPFEWTSSYPITAEQAWNIANAYWNNANGIHDGAAGTLVVYKVVLLDTPSADTNDYRIGLQGEFFSNFDITKDCNPPWSIQLYEQLLVNAFTGEVREYVEPEAGGKG